MSDNKNMTNEELAVAGYKNDFVPKVHRVGRATMFAGLVFGFAPIVWLYFIKGYHPDTTLMITIMVSVTGMQLGGWLTENLAQFPLLGGAGQYMGSLAGNTTNMRIPVATAVQSSIRAGLDTPRGQMGTIIGIAMSVYVNLIILFIIVIGGEFILSLLPDVVMQAFDYVVPSLIASVLTMRFLSDPKTSCKLIWIPAVIFALSFFVSFLGTFGMAISTGLTILTAVVMTKSQMEAGKKA